MLAQQVGFEYISTGKMQLTSRIGANKTNTKRDEGKWEPLLTFRKPLDMNNFGNNVKVEVDY